MTIGISDALTPWDRSSPSLTQKTLYSVPLLLLPILRECLSKWIFQRSNCVCMKWNLCVATEYPQSTLMVRSFVYFDSCSTTLVIRLFILWLSAMLKIKATPLSLSFGTVNLFLSIFLCCCIPVHCTRCVQFASPWYFLIETHPFLSDASRFSFGDALCHGNSSDWDLGCLSLS